MSPTELNDLLVRISDGDNVAFEELYARTCRGVYAFVCSYFKNAADVEDVMQTVYLKIKLGIHTYRKGSNGKAWVLQIAKNQALNELKKRAREIPSEEIEIVSEEPVLGGTVTETMKQALSAEEQRIVALHVLWGYKHREIAQLLGCPTGTVTSKYKRSIEKLRKIIKEDER